MTGVAQRPWRGGGRSALRPGAAAAAPLTPGGSRRPGLDSRPATSSDALSAASAPGARRRYVALPCTASTLTRPACIFGCLASSLSRSGHHLSNFTSTTHLPAAAAAVLAGNVGSACRREPGWAGGADPLQAGFPVWLELAFPSKSQVFPSGGALYYDVPCDACNGFPRPFCTEGRTSLQKKVDVKQGKFAPLDSERGVTLSLQ